MTVEQRNWGVSLPHGHTGSSYFHQLLLQAADAFPELAKAALPPQAGEFRAHFAKVLPRFELLRLLSPRRAEIARFLCQKSEDGLRFCTDKGEIPLAEAWDAPKVPLPVVEINLPGPGRLTPSVTFEGRLHEGARLTGLSNQLEEQRRMTPAARDGLLWVNALAQSDAGLSLQGQRFVLLGAGAELAPVDLLLGAGAAVLWLDLRDPAIDRLLSPRLSGSLQFVRGGVNLLSAPSSVAATIERFASEGPVHICMYAYARGECQEWRLTAAMNAIVRSLPRACVASVVTLLPPGTPASVCDEDAHAAALKKTTATRWERSLLTSHALQDGFEQDENIEGLRVARAIVKAQGVSHQAAQYVGKMLATEAYSVYGNRLELTDTGAAQLTVSANVAPITATRSRQHPLFQAAFLGAPAFQILVTQPETTRTLTGLLTLHDLLQPDGQAQSHADGGAPHGRLSALFSRQIHGGVYAQPYALDGCIRLAAMRGLTQKPRLALSLFR